MQLYTSAGCKKIEVFAKQLGVKLEKIIVEDKAQIEKLSVFKKLPVLVNNDDVICGADAILKYMAEDFPIQWMTEFQLAICDQWINFSSQELERFAENKKEALRRLTALNDVLIHQTFLVGERLTVADIAVACAVEAIFEGLTGKEKKSVGHVARWLETVINQSCFVVEEEKEEEEEESDDDLFGSDSEEDEEAAKAAEERAKKAAAAKAAKAHTGGRTQYVFEVKPFDADTDLEALFKKIVACKIDGLNWGEGHELKPVGYGIFKLMMTCVVFDDVAGENELVDCIEAFEDEVQSIDIAAMNKV
eukprot:TRINITY_DN949_c0_g1_i1.p1 TRINITY_DN949_c0_g1~~TRINITY_DN949_c0_g1_i1.p1  ORF type:complete len:314 (-),score=106.13 TRINITY_DN949_c0_g1_i1:119-1033(-)